MMKKSNKLRNRNWCFTLNNYTELEVDSLKQFAESDNCRYLIFGYETSQDGSTPHLQGYCETDKAYRLNSLRMRCTGFSRAHLESRKGSPTQASEYCKKEGHFSEFGEISVAKQGNRTDLEEIKHDIEDGAGERQIADNYFSKWVVYRTS